MNFHYFLFNCFCFILKKNPGFLEVEKVTRCSTNGLCPKKPVYVSLHWVNNYMNICFDCMNQLCKWCLFKIGFIRYPHRHFNSTKSYFVPFLITLLFLKIFIFFVKYFVSMLLQLNAIHSHWIFFLKSWLLQKNHNCVFSMLFNSFLFKYLLLQTRIQFEKIVLITTWKTCET